MLPREVDSRWFATPSREELSRCRRCRRGAMFVAAHAFPSSFFFFFPSSFLCFFSFFYFHEMPLPFDTAHARPPCLNAATPPCRTAPYTFARCRVLIAAQRREGVALMMRRPPVPFRSPAFQERQAPPAPALYAPPSCRRPSPPISPALRFAEAAPPQQRPRQRQSAAVASRRCRARFAPCRRYARSGHCFLPSPACPSCWRRAPPRRKCREASSTLPLLLSRPVGSAARHAAAPVAAVRGRRARRLEARRAAQQ